MNERTNQPKTFEEWQREYLKSNHDFYLRLPSEQDRIIWAAAQAEIAGLRETDQQEIGRLGTELVVAMSTILRLEEEIARLSKSASQFGARVKERVPSWFEEASGSTDFAEARDELTAVLTAQAEKEKP